LKKIVLVAFVSVPLLLGCIPVVSTQETTDPYHMIVATVGEPYTVDPAWAYDDADSSELIFNVYETLIFYDRESVSRFVPMLATDWQISEDGLTYIFKIRQGVKFHNGELLTTDDVEYSFERVMVQDRGGGPGWMLYEPLLGCRGANLSDPDWGVKIDNAVQRNTTHVWFNLIKPYAPFIQILCESCSSIVNKKFCVEHGDWPGTWDNWQDYHDPYPSPLDSPEPMMSGTGPYRLDYWTYEVEYSLVKFDDYWQGWPAPSCRGYVSRVTIKLIPESSKRFEGFKAGDYDIIRWIPRYHYKEFEGQPGILFFKDLPMLQCYAFLFNFHISTTSPYMGVPGGLAPGTFNETAIPPDFFNDIHVRKAFAYCFNYSEYIQEYLGRTLRPSSPMLKGLAYWEYCWDVDNTDLAPSDIVLNPPWSQPLLPNGSGALPPNPMYYTNLTEAEYYFKLAYGGSGANPGHNPNLITPGLLWMNGFTLTIPGKTGGCVLWCEFPYRMKKAVESLNPKFHIDVVITNYFTYLEQLARGELTLFLRWFVADHPDPHNIFYFYMHSEGFSRFQGYTNPTVDALVEAGLAELDENKRIEIYWKLCNIYFQDCSSIPMFQQDTSHWERTWVQGWYHNPAYPGIYFYPLWKRSMLYGDVNNDGVVNIEDIVIVAKAYGSYPGHPRWNETADVDKNGIVNIIDAVRVAKEFGKTV